MGEKFSHYDSADYLETEEDIRLFLEASLEEGGDDPAFITHALGVIARARNMTLVAREAGMTRAGLYKALSPSGNPSFATVSKVAKALGLKITIHSNLKSGPFGRL